MSQALSSFPLSKPLQRALARVRGDAAPDARRRAFMLGVPAGLAIASPAALLGCGGDGGGGGGDDAAEEAAVQARLQSLNNSLGGAQRTLLPLKVQLPAGAKPTLAGATLMTAFNQSEVSAADGTCGAAILEGGAQLACLVDAAGELLLMGFVETGGTDRLNERTTAEALILLASDVSQHTPALQLALRKTLATHAVVAPVAAAVTAALARGPLSENDPALVGAVNSALDQLRPSRTGPAAARPGTVRTQSLRVWSSAGGDTEATAQSGVWLRATADYNTFEVVNRFRRRAHVWVDRLQYKTSDGAAFESPQALKDFPLDGTTALSFNSLVVTVADFYASLAQDLGFIEFYENDPDVWTPVASAPLALPVAPADKDPSSSIYTVRVVGPGTGAGDQPLSAAEEGKLSEILLTTWIEDIVTPFIQNIVAPWLTDFIVTNGGERFAAVSKELTAWMISDVSSSAAGRQFFPNTWAALRDGDLVGAASSIGFEFLNSSAFQVLLHRSFSALAWANPDWKNALRDATGKPISVNQFLEGGKARGDVVKAFSSAMTKLARVINVIKSAATVGDFGAMAKDWRASSKLELMFVEATRAKLTLTPNPLEVALNDSNPAPVTAKLEGLDAGIPAADVFVEWSCTGRWGYLIRVGGNNEVNEFTAPLSAPAHNYFRSGGGQTDPNTPDVITAVAVYRNPTTAAREEIGRASVTVRFRKEFTLAFNFAPGTEVPTDTPLPVTCFVKEKLPAGASVAWTWQHAGVGSLAAVPADNVPSDSAATLNTGANEGTATLTVTARISLPATTTLPARTVDTDPVALPLTVKKGLRTITFEAQGGAFACTDTRACGVGFYGAYLVPVMAKATNYTAVFTGFGYGPCNRSVSWTAPKGDGGGCNFPISYHPHNSQGPTNTWAVWLGFSDTWNPGGGKCTVTITLAP